jgi:hypothetical protein
MAREKRIVKRLVLGSVGLVVLASGVALTFWFGTDQAHPVAAGLGIAGGGCALWEAVTNPEYGAFL